MTKVKERPKARKIPEMSARQFGHLQKQIDLNLASLELIFFKITRRGGRFLNKVNAESFTTCSL
jgi:hypothetical protein